MELTPSQLKALDLNRNFVLNASAGSGKTTVLIKRFIHILLNQPNLNISNVLAITFTDKAASEMRDRIFNEILNRFETNQPEQPRLFQLLNQLHTTNIYTIHTFCSNLLRQHHLEANLNPGFNIMDDTQRDDLLNQMFRDFFADFIISEVKNKEYILSLLQELPIYKIKNILFTLYRSRSLINNFIKEELTSFPKKLVNQWGNLFLDYHKKLLQSLFDNSQFWMLLQELTEISTKYLDNTLNLHTEIQILYNQVIKNKPINVTGLQSTIKLLKLLTKKDGDAYKKIPGGKKYWGDYGLTIFNQLSQIASNFTENLINIDISMEKSYSRIVAGLRSLTQEFLRRVEKEKISYNLMDFEDLQIKTLDLLKNNIEIRKKIKKQFPFILVDEFQDTDQLQSSIIHLLSHDLQNKLDDNRLFLVGDPKQSIFGFRHADVNIFKDFTKIIRKQETEEIPFTILDSNDNILPNKDELSGLLILSENFRSTSNLINFYNKTFKSIFTIDSNFDVNYQPLKSTHPDIHGFESEILLDLFHIQNIEEFDTAMVQAIYMALKIKDIVHSNNYKKLLKRNNQIHLESFNYQDIAILIRSRHYLNIIEEVLRDSGIPYQTYKGAGFFQQLEIQSLFYILKFLINPEDDFALLTFFRSEFMGISDTTLFYLAQIGGKNYWERVNKLMSFLNGLVDISEIFKENFYLFIKTQSESITLLPGEKESLRILNKNFNKWNQMAINGKFSRVITNIVEELNIKSILTIQQDGNQKIANLNKFLHYIYENEQKNQFTFENLLDRINKQILGETKESEATIILENEDNVKILTYHSAKGTEYPVVFLPYLEQPFQYNREFFLDKKYGFSFTPDRLKEKTSLLPFIHEFLKKRDRSKIDAEEKRLFYVAATRAKDHLFLSGSILNGEELSNSCYLHWLLNAFEYQKSKTDCKDLHLFEDDNFTFKIKNTLIQNINQLPKVLIPTNILKNNSDIYFKKNKKYSQPLAEKANNRIYTVTQLMLFCENKQRYFNHFYLNDGVILPPFSSPEITDETEGALIGSLIHKLLENFYSRSPEEDEIKIQQIVKQLGLIETEQKSTLIIKMKEFITKFRKSKLSLLTTGTELKSEFSVEQKLDSFLIKGIFDLILKNRNGLWEVIDFKTNRVYKKGLKQLTNKYEFQMSVYAMLLSGLYPQQKVYPISLFFTDTMSLVRFEYKPQQIEKIKSEIKQLCQNLSEMDREFFSN